jgi:hypothetical protein
MTHMARRARAAVTALYVAAAVIAARAEAQPGMTYESIARLPDFSGWWHLDLDPNKPGDALNLVFNPHEALPKPEIAERVKDLPVLSDVPGDTRQGYCEPYVFTGFNDGFESSVEFLFTPGRVTVTNEAGMVRRVFLNQPLPTDADESSAGSSVGHWEGNTLVVETAAVDRNGFLMRAVQIGTGARIVERLSLRDKDTLEIARRVVAPDVLTGPSDTTLVYVRDTDHVFHEASHCAKDDRSVDHETGRQRFDLTPPADLPPPPR